MSSGWRTKGACNGLPYELMVMDDDATEQVAAAKAVCSGCVVAEICLSAELDRMRHDFVPTIGVLGGTSAAERVDMVDVRPVHEIDHGTHRGYRRCNMRPEGACEPCKAGLARYVWELRDRRGRTDKERARNKRGCIAYMRERRREALAESLALRQVAA